MSSNVDKATDYNDPGQSPRELRVGPVLGWMLTGVVVGLGLLWLDGPVAGACRRFQPGGDLSLGGDVRRTLEFLQQFGDLASSVVAGIVILLLDRSSRRRILDWVFAACCVEFVVKSCKVLAGRPRPGVIFGGHARPGFDSPTAFYGPLTDYPLPRLVDGQWTHVPTHAGSLFGRSVSDLWSMPSSHASAAAVLAVALWSMYPRLRWFGLVMLGIALTSRVLLGAHYPSDVVVGASVGLGLATLAMQGRWGSRLVGRPSGVPVQGCRAQARS